MDPEPQLHGFIVGVEFSNGLPSQEVVAVITKTLTEALQMVAGIGEVDVEYLGPIQVYDPSMEPK